jgi:hypothetical protein
MRFFKRLNTRVLGYESNHKFAPKFITPSKSFIPEWYKESPAYPREKNPFKNRHLKQCVPFLDALTAGYCLTTPVDLYVSQREDGPWIEWGASDTAPIEVRDKSVAPTFPTPHGFSKIHFLWSTNGCILIPKGYSVIFTHPLNRVDLPFITLSGIVDDFLMHSGTIPFFLQNDFTGLIPAGTPFVQIIPFKRENWISKEIKGLYSKSLPNKTLSLSSFKGWYKQSIWKKKTYN